MGKKRKQHDELPVQVNHASKKQKQHDVSPVEVKHANKKRKGNQATKNAKSSETFEEKLARSDPDFLKFLKNEKSDLLAFDDGELSAESEDDGVPDDSDVEDDDRMETNAPKMNSKLKKSRGVMETEEQEEEDLSGDSDGDEDDRKKQIHQSKVPLAKKTVVTVKMVQRWTKQLRDKNSLPVMSELVAAFKAALQQIGTTEDDVSKFRVSGSEVFNAVVQACLQEMVPFLLRHLRLSESKDPNKPTLPSSSPRWKQVRQDVKCYIGDIMQLVTSVGSVEVVRPLLKHILDLVTFAVGFPKVSKSMLKKLIEIWSSCSDEKNTLLAFCAIHRLLRLSQESLFDVGFKLMYTAYVKNTKFTSTNTLSSITVMQRSLVEVGKLRVNVTYKFAFTYIRQLAIHLRSAITTKKKETMQIVYNWQFMHSLSLWTKLICELNSDEYIKSLIYPLTQIIIGTIKLVPTAQYYPLRFLCVRELSKLSAATSTFIPVLPYLTEVLNEVDFRRPVRGSSMQSLNFMCILKLSKSELNTKAFRDGVVDQLFELMLDNLHVYSHTIGFPELCLPVLIELRKFIKSCKVPSYTRTMKELVAKVTETSNFITERRRASTLNLRDLAAVATWESSCREAGTPLGKFYATWRKLRDQQQRSELQSGQKQRGKESKEGKKLKNKKDNISSDEDFDDEELVKLAQSASEDEESSQESSEDGSDDDDGFDDSEESDTAETRVGLNVSDVGGHSKKTDSKMKTLLNEENVKKSERSRDRIDKDSTDDSSDEEEDDVVENISLSDSDNDEVDNVGDDDDVSDSNNSDDNDDSDD